ncbi:hypothetical protein EK21DRAFT_63436 [Setomelanomma holmii]|uniref:Uncharacterized protein n=1 Tax=Setomelanomma holmii TaxID=210430 RepID=A0A9P4HAZ6_9PLEO|nr:hypothetical protein EK21DRAFT_63436 [Setomelanomma holmii]
MSDFEWALEPYNLEAALEADRGDDCLIIDIRGDVHGLEGSLKYITARVDYYLHYAEAPAFAATKLYVVGDWIPALSMIDEDEEIDEVKLRSNVQHLQGIAADTEEWDLAANKITELLRQAQCLQELTWICGMPFFASHWEVLPTSLTKLVLNLGQPVRLDRYGDLVHRSYITSVETQPLLEQTQLKELRLFQVHNSFQSIVWETVFRNTSKGGMQILDIQMASPPIVRSEQWRKAKDVTGLTVPTESEEKIYKGLDGKGVLHFSIGTGEYLDDLCIRKARIASGLDEATSLPLWCLRLDGFVLDHLPFEHELSRIVLLNCGEDCIDSGLRAPKTAKVPHNKWSKAVNNAASHCLIKWPNWQGVFDASGNQRNKSGEVISQELNLSTPLNESAPVPVAPAHSPMVSLTARSLNMKSLGEALRDTQGADYFGHPAPSVSSGTKEPLSVLSKASTRGSAVPIETVTSSTNADSPSMSTVDDNAPAGVASFADPDLTDVDEADSPVPLSVFSSFGETATTASDEASNKTTGSSTPGTETDELVNVTIIDQKVRHFIRISGAVS